MKVALTLALVVWVGGNAAAQNAPAAKPAAPSAEPAPAAPEAPPPYEPQMLRMAEILGALAFLRDLCGDGDGDALRTKMAGLLDTEGGPPARRELFAGAFNRGYRDYAVAYRVCTPAAREAIGRFLTETEKLALDLKSRFGG